MTARYVIRRIEEMPAIDLPAGLRWHPVRIELGLRAFGASAYSAHEPGEVVVEPHRETEARGHEELYLVLAGAARFELDGEEVDAAAGTLVNVREPDVQRAAVATEPGTVVLVLGGPPTFEPAGSEWLELARPKLATDRDAARALLERGLTEIPESAAVRLGFALLAAHEGDRDRAAADLRDAVSRDPGVREAALQEELLRLLALQLGPPDAAVEEATLVSDELVEAMDRLVGQLSRSAPPPGRSDVERIVSSPATRLLLARDERGEIVGTLTLALFRLPTGMRAWIEDVVVDEAARAAGVGAALVEEALRLANAAGARTVDLTSRPDRKAANRLYARLGFDRRETNVYRHSSR